jgi:hypothetical protein
MAALDHGLVPGQVSPEHFDLLLAGTLIRGVALIAALRDHFVGGLSSSAAWDKHGVNKSQFSRRLAVILGESERAKKLSQFYQKR